MSRDSKLGLVLGVGLVLTIAITFFRKDQAAATPTTSVQTAKPAKSADLPSPPPQTPAPSPPQN